MFDLKTANEEDSIADHHTSLAAVSAASRADAAQLGMQWHDVLPVALHFFRGGSAAAASRDAVASAGSQVASVREAWREALLHCNKQHLRKVHPTHELRKALATYFAMSVSTSGVEQKFSRAQAKLHSRISATARLEDIALKVMQDADEYDVQTLCHLAW